MAPLEERTTVLYWSLCPCGDCHQTRAYLFACIFFITGQCPQATLPHSAQRGCQGGHPVVALFPKVLERLIVLPIANSIYTHLFRRLGHRGVINFAVGWFQLRWPVRCDGTNIGTKELLPIVVAAAMWGASWQGAHVCFHSDNMAVVMVINKHLAKDVSTIHLLRCLFFYLAYFKFHYSAVHT